MNANVLNSIYFLFLAFAMVPFMSCERSPSASGGTEASIQGTGDFSAYTLTALGNGLDLAEKTGPGGNTVERGFVKEGRRHGQWLTFGSDGRITSITPYLNGQVYGAAIGLDQRMQIETVSSMIADRANGLNAEYNRGRPMQVLNYKNDRLHGLQRFYFESGPETGKIQRTVEYENGVVDGLMRYYDPGGNVTVEYRYEDGVRTGGGMVEETQ